MEYGCSYIISFSVHLLHRRGSRDRKEQEQKEKEDKEKKREH
jgi:hypothetical protein